MTAADHCRYVARIIPVNVEPFNHIRRVDGIIAVNVDGIDQRMHPRDVDCSLMDGSAIVARAPARNREDLANDTRYCIFQSMDEKPIEWVGSALDDLRGFPDDARRRAGFELHQVQCGRTPSDWKPIPAIGSGVAEIRIRTTLEHRVFYLAKFEEAVYVLHALEKKSQKTPKHDLDLVRSRLASVLAERRVAARLDKEEP